MGAIMSVGRWPFGYPVVGNKRKRESVDLDGELSERRLLQDSVRQNSPFKKARLRAGPAKPESRSQKALQLGARVQSGFDVSPDGSTHRYKVRCPALHWGNKKDVIRVLNRMPDFPPYSSVQKLSKWDHFFISFPNAIVAADGFAMLAQITFKGDTWTAIKVTDISAKRARIDKVIKLSFNQDGHETHRKRPGAADVTAPWRSDSYEEQLRRKWETMTEALSNVTRQMRNEKFAAGAVPWLDALRSGMRPRGDIPGCCPLQDLIPATPGVEGGRDYYRNKNEFTVGLSVIGEPTVGFSLGLVRDGEFCVGAVTEECITTGRIARQVATVMTDLVRRSGRAPYDKRTHEGYWRQVMCRHSDRTRTVVVVPMVCSIAKDRREDHVSGEDSEVWSDDECRKQVAYAIEELCAANGFRWGLFWQVSDHVSAPASDVPMQWVTGVDRMEEIMMDLTFRVHPAAFFQVNTIMAEKLYTVIRDIGGVGPSSVVLDICCGTGTIGLSLARRAQLVVGVEMCGPAVADARANATQNCVSNVHYIEGKVEDKIREALSRVGPARECIAIVDPPRAGVHNNVSLREPNFRC